MRRGAREALSRSLGGVAQPSKSAPVRPARVYRVLRMVDMRVGDGGFFLDLPPIRCRLAASLLLHSTSTAVRKISGAFAGFGVEAVAANSPDSTSENGCCPRASSPEKHAARSIGRAARFFKKKLGGRAVMRVGGNGKNQPSGSQ